MRVTGQFILCSIMLSTLFALTSCRTSRNMQRTDYNSLARAGLRLGVDIDYEDNHALFIYSSQWLGTPYRNGGNDKQGIDCSGLSYAIYRDIFNIKISRTSRQQFEQDFSTFKNKNKLKPGDLVFFTSPGAHGTVNHVGVYLKEGRFIHSSSTKGVVVDDLHNPYWDKNWIAGGTICK